MGSLSGHAAVRSTGLEHARLRRLPSPHPCDLLQARFVTHAFAPHAHETYAIGVCASGRVGLAHGGARHTLGAGDLLLLNPGELHTGEPADADGWSYTMVYPPVALVRRVADMVRGRPGPAPLLQSPFVRDPWVAGEASRHLGLLADPDAALAAECALLGLVELAVRASGELRVRRLRLEGLHPRIRRVREFLHAEFARRVTIDELARVAGLSPYHMIRTFHARMGMPPYMYLEHLRVERAKILLRAGVPIRDAAARTGFGDQSHFTRRFKRVTGIPPGRYARQVGGSPAAA